MPNACRHPNPEAGHTRTRNHAPECPPPAMDWGVRSAAVVHVQARQSVWLSGLPGGQRRGWWWQPLLPTCPHPRRDQGRLKGPAKASCPIIPSAASDPRVGTEPSPSTTRLRGRRFTASSVIRSVGGCLGSWGVPRGRMALCTRASICVCAWAWTYLCRLV